MGVSEEPDWNIDGGVEGRGVPTTFDAGEPATTAEAIVDRLGAIYWEKAYGGQDAFECLVRTILSQNTSDAASQPAFDALLDRYENEGGDGFAERLVAADQDRIAATIQPAGLHNQKAAVIQGCAARILEAFGDAASFDAFVRGGDRDRVRETLLDFDGVGPKTADCVLLFAGGQTGVFPVDTHVHRIYRRLGIAAPDADHEAVRDRLEDAVPADKCGFGHTASIEFGREYCTARTPVCLEDPGACPLSEYCDRVGVDVDAGTVTDPADTVE